MSDANEHVVQSAIATISQSDPLIKLLQQVKQGQMKASDPGLRAITEAWLETYRKVLDTTTLSRQVLARVDPSPRLDVLIEAGVLNPDHQAVSSLRASFEKALAQAVSE